MLNRFAIFIAIPVLFTSVACVDTAFKNEDERFISSDADADTDTDTDGDTDSDTDADADADTDADSDTDTDTETDSASDTATDQATESEVETDDTDIADLWAAYNCTSNDWVTCDPAICQRKQQLTNDSNNCTNNASDSDTCNAAVELCYVEFITCMNCPSGGTLDDGLLQVCETSRQTCTQAAFQ